MAHASQEALRQIEANKAEGTATSVNTRAALAVSNDWRQHPVTRGLVAWLTEERDRHMTLAQSTASLDSPSRAAEHLIEARAFSAMLNKITNP